MSLVLNQLPHINCHDVVFTVNGEEWAIEIETGSQLKKNKKELLQKVQANNKKYAEKWFFIVTNKNLLADYRKLGEAIDRNSVIERLNEIRN